VQLGRSTDELVSSVLANASTRICFRLGDQDARRLADGFSFFEARDLQNLGVGEAIVRAERAENDFNLRTAEVPAIEPEEARARTAKIVASSRKLFATPVSELSQSAPVRAAHQPPQNQQRAPDPAVSLTRQPPGRLPDRAALAAARPAAETGRGGEQHRYLQTLIRRLAEERGFRVSLEVSVLSGTGNIDVVMERENLSVACEISVTTSTGHEVGNLQKCLAAGFERVLLVAPTGRVLNRIRKRAGEVFAGDELSKMHFILPESVPEWLDQSSLPASRSETVRGYTVNVGFSTSTTEEAATRSEKLRDLLRKSLRRNRRE